MEHGEQTYRRLWGRGGAYDTVSTLQGLGRAATERERARAYMTAPIARTDIQVYLTAAAAQESATPEAPANPWCSCVVLNIPIDAAQQRQFEQMCVADPAAFEAALRERGISVECGAASAVQKPWYKKPSTYFIGVSVIGALALLYSVAR